MKEYDYYGVPITTYDKDELREIMEKIIYPTEPKYMLFSEEGIEKEEDKIFPKKDKELLVEYAPKLFNTSKSEDVEKDMYGLAKVFWTYRLHQSPHYAYNRIIDSYPETLHRNYKTYRKNFQNHILDALKILNNAHDVSFDTIDDETNEMIKSNIPSSTEVKKFLEELAERADSYIPAKPPKPKASKKSIDKYLMGLSLPYKSETIKEFIKKIE